jgi:hypothetical protein
MNNKKTKISVSFIMTAIIAKVVNNIDWLILYVKIHLSYLFLIILSGCFKVKYYL